MANKGPEVIVGISTHADRHVAVISGDGVHLADKEYLAVGSGYRRIIGFITA